MSADMYTCDMCGQWSYSYWDCTECGRKMHDRKAAEAAWDKEAAPVIAKVQKHNQKRDKARADLKAKNKRLRKIGKR